MAIVRGGLVQLESSAFHGWDGNSCAVEISQLPNRGIGLMQRVFDDAIDEGFILKSRVTGKRRLFTLAGTDTVDGEVQGWRFVSNMEIRGGSGSRGLAVLVESVYNILVIND